MNEATSMKPPRFSKAEQFWIEYVDDITGQVNVKRVSGHKLASEVARRLAIASGKRAIIHRGEPDALNAWKVFVIDVEDGGKVISKMEVLNKEVAAKVFKMWREIESGAVCVMWPSWAPPPIISI